MLALLDLAALLATSGKLFGSPWAVTDRQRRAPPTRSGRPCPSVGVVTLPFLRLPSSRRGCGENTNELPLDHFRMYIPSPGLAARAAPLPGAGPAPAPPRHGRHLRRVHGVGTPARGGAGAPGTVTFLAVQRALHRHLAPSAGSGPQHATEHPTTAPVMDDELG
ncbi:hypothetical protein HU200_009998 [Digitaria exilis]|uniref:Secreted protein n=1 Tax=Digitaria exilis TaxID=1010633 RepID=A0A835FKJ5_9POAL|nr:hypothetical protein HU200_009998 [Digitaria exilis]